MAKRKPIKPEHKAVRAWVLSNRGVMQRIADRVMPPVKHQFVQAVAYGNTKFKLRVDHPVLRELKDAGWPGCK